MAADAGELRGDDEFDRAWRPSAGSRLAYGVIVAIFALLAVAGLANALGGGDIGSSLLVAVVNAAVAACAWRWGSHPLIGATAEGVTVRNPLRTVVVAWAVPKPTLSIWFGRVTRADEVVGYIATRALAHQGGGIGDPPFPGGEDVPPA